MTTSVEDPPDDVDDLDDLLDDFVEKPSEKPEPTLRAPSPIPSSDKPVLGPERPDTSDTDVIDEEELMREMQKEMEEAFRNFGLAGEPRSLNGNGTGSLDQDEMLAKMFEQLMAGSADSDPVQGNAPKGKQRAPSAAPDGDFQDQIRRTMEKLKESDEGVKAGLDKEEDPLAAMLKMMTGGQSEEDLRDALEGMMGQLLSKDILEEPLQALMEKYPDYLAKNKSTLSPADVLRYERQMGAIQQMLGIFRSPNYSAEDEETSKKITELMQVMQDCGAPPGELLGELPDGIELDPATGMPALPEGCTIS